MIWTMLCWKSLRKSGLQLRAWVIPGSPFMKVSRLFLLIFASCLHVCPVLEVLGCWSATLWGHSFSYPSVLYKAGKMVCGCYFCMLKWWLKLHNVQEYRRNSALHLACLNASTPILMLCLVLAVSWCNLSKGALCNKTSGLPRVFWEVNFELVCGFPIQFM